MSFNDIPVMKKSVAKPARRTKKEEREMGFKTAIGMLEHRLKSLRNEKEGPHTQGAIRNFESRIKRLKMDLAAL